MRLRLLLLMTLAIQFAFAQYDIAENVLHNAHSHNDYQKDIPLWQALTNGCASMEVDVFAHNKELKVAHIKFALNIRQTFTEMYLEPLIEIIETRGYIYKETPLVLMLDFKSSADSTLPILLETIAPYKQYFSHYVQDSIIQGDIQLVISGSGFNYSQVSSLDSIYVFLDGSVQACETDFPAQLVPRGSARYGSLFKWKGKGDMPSEELELLRELVSNAKSCNKKLRFYAMPENERIWETFLEEGVEWINVDNSTRFLYFMNE